ncbi:MAG: ABC transporter substrate-binding protein [bacterium]
MNASNGVGGRRFTVETVDDQGSPERAVQHFERLVKEDAVAIVGPLTDATTIAAAGAAERLKVVLITPGATATLPFGGHFVFRTALPVRNQAGTMAGFLVDTLGLRRIAIVHDSNDYGTMIAQAFEDAVKAREAVVTSRRLYRDGDTAFGRHVRGALVEKATAVFLAGYPDEGGHLLRQLRAVAPQLIVAGSDALYSENTLAWAGAAADGLYVPTSFVADAQLPVVRAFVAKYERKHGRTPDQFAAQAYDSVRVLAAGLRRSGVDRQKLRDVIATSRRYPGVTGEITFDRWGDPGRDVVIYRVKGGAFVPVNP